MFSCEMAVAGPQTACPLPPLRVTAFSCGCLVKPPTQAHASHPAPAASRSLSAPSWPSHASRKVTAAAGGQGFPLWRAHTPNEDERSENKRRQVFKYINSCEPNEVQAFIEQNPPAVVAAFKKTVNNMVGSLPPQHFSVTIDTVADSLATLMMTMLRTGYLLRSAQYQLDLELALRSAASLNVAGLDASDALDNSTASAVSLPSLATMDSSSTASTPSSSPTSAAAALLGLGRAFEPTLASRSEAAPPSTQQAGSTSNLVQAAPSMLGWKHPDQDYAPGVQLTKVEGDVMRWNHTHGLERMPAKQYIQNLESQLTVLKEQLQQLQQLQMQQPVAPVAASGGTAQLSRVQYQGPPSTLQVATSVAGEAMNNSHNPALAAAAASAAAANAATSGFATPSTPDLLTYLRTLNTETLMALGCCGEHISDAMAAFVARLMGTHEREQLKSIQSEFSAMEMSKLMLWLLVVGWSLRALEVRLELEDAFGPNGASSAAAATGLLVDRDDDPGVGPWGQWLLK